MNNESMKHTHRGSCQACGRMQAIMLKDGNVAKHGYTVDWGFFKGTCMGSDAKPLEQDRSMTDQVIKLLGLNAERADERARDLESGKVEPVFYKRIELPRKYGERQKYQDTPCRRHELSDAVAQQQIRAAIFNAQSEARSARAHAKMLVKLIDERHGKPLTPVQREDKKELCVGAQVRIGGSKGFIAEVVELRHQVARGCGPYMNGKDMLHAILKREGRDGTFAVPARTIRQAAIISVTPPSNDPTEPMRVEVQAVPMKCENKLNSWQDRWQGI